MVKVERQFQGFWTQQASYMQKITLLRQITQVAKSGEMMVTISDSSKFRIYSYEIIFFVLKSFHSIARRGVSWEPNRDNELV